MQMRRPQPKQPGGLGAFLTVLGAGLIAFFLYAVVDWGKLFVLAGLAGGVILARGVSLLLARKGP